MEKPYLMIADDVKLGKNVRFFGFANIYGCEIGDDTAVGPFVEIQSDVRIGKRVKVQSHSFICSGVEIHDEVFIGHGVIFTNDRFPRSTNKDGSSKDSGGFTLERTVVSHRASIGSGATILCGITIGADAMIGAGSVVVSDVPANAVVAGNPAKIIRVESEPEAT